MASTTPVAPDDRIDPVSVFNLEVLAPGAKVEIPNLSELGVLSATSLAAEDPGAAGMTDAQIIRTYVDGISRNYGDTVVRLSSAIDAANRLGTDKLLRIGARMKSSVRLQFAALAFREGWLIANLETITALSKGCNLLDLLGRANLAKGLDADVTVSALTKLVADGHPDGLQRAMQLWISAHCPEGVVDDDVVASLGLEGAVGAFGKRKSRLSLNAAVSLAKAAPQCAGLAANLCYVRIPDDTLVGLYDATEAALIAEAPLVCRLALSGLVGTMVSHMTHWNYYPEAMLARCKAYLLSGEDAATTELGDLVVMRCPLTVSELARLVVHGTSMARWLDDGYVANGATEATAKALIANPLRRCSLLQVLEQAERNRTDPTTGLFHPDHLNWLIPALADDDRAPTALRAALTGGYGNITPDSVWSVLVEAAGMAFAGCSDVVTARLWRALVSNPSVFDSRDMSFRDIAALFVERDEVAKNRIASRGTSA